ncbi:TetR/AcrR family transcriptional regulator [Burkholderia multivorans]|uniref:TetR/AcrR family transcriptional regulator n=1 Tax=Burkholderia multivorans TaxID=87883 RepID=UPI00209C7C07|nr:TetR/AcrR family transcriptional regulator [Burkholderia multivorans]MCO8626402.1 TetR/AcrR family transcriptional regulator [Burkholderia multivorans]
MTVSIEQRNNRKRRSTGAVAGADSTEGLRAQGIRTRNKIVRVARKLLLQGGALEFSQRGVAAAAGITVSNLQYYFPTRLAILRAVVEPVISTYLNDLRSALATDALPRDVLEQLMERALRDAKDTQIRAQWAHFFSFAAVDDECRRLVDEWYATLIHELAQLVRAANPAHSATESRNIATLLISMTDGLTFQSGDGRRTPSLEAKFREVCNFLVYGKSSNAIGK